MLLVAEYLERAAHFQTLADAEADPKLRKRLSDQSMAYLNLASKRARELGLPPPQLPGVS
jgi:hypothetical protein